MGSRDELGTLNYVTPADIVAAAQLVRSGKVVSLALPFDQKGRAYGLRGRFNPIHMMICTGTDAYSATRTRPACATRRYRDHAPQCGTQWDALSPSSTASTCGTATISAWSTSTGARKNGIEKTKSKMSARLFLDVPRVHGLDWPRTATPSRVKRLDYVAQVHG